MAQVFPNEFCEISKNTSFHKTHLVAAFNNTRALNKLWSFLDANIKSVNNFAITKFL